MKPILVPILALLCGLFINLNPAFAQVGTVWQYRNVPAQDDWVAVACSADGTKIIAAAYGLPGSLYISTNSGATWALTTGPAFVEAGRTLACSADGQVLAVANKVNGIYVSTDGGATWTVRATAQIWQGIACSTNGTKMVAVTSGDQIYTSTDTGTNWTARDSVRYWTDVASSADGTKLAAAAGGYSSSPDQIYTSTDSGTNWIPRGALQAWTGIASSADGTKLVAVNLVDTNYPGFAIGQIYTSNNSGTNWTEVSYQAEPNLNWASVASSADGTRLAAIGSIDFVLPGLIYTSTNSGATWRLSFAPDGNWASIASSADGTKLVAAATYPQGNGIAPAVYTYAAPSTNAPALSIATAGGYASLTWPWPSTGFVLQQNSNLATMNWVTVSNTPAVVNQVITVQTNNQNFYRLANP
jgi:photosystem II stability/assembly factor-like uncharacterized protein